MAEPRSTSSSDAPTVSKKPRIEEESHPPVEAQRGGDPITHPGRSLGLLKEDDAHGSEDSEEAISSDDTSSDDLDDDTSSDDSDDSEDESDGDADTHVSPRKETSVPGPSAPCTCQCGGCCCHTTQTDPHHCVRCHADYTFNYPEACTVPHVFYREDLSPRQAELATKDVIVRSLCCGSDVCGGEPIDGDWSHPTTCFSGWHTTDVDTVEREEYNGLNVLRCDPDPDPEHRGKCRRRHLKFLDLGGYEHVFDDQVKYNKRDRKDRKAYLKRVRKYDPYDMFEHVAEAENIGKRKRRVG